MPGRCHTADAVEAINLTKRYKDDTALNSMNLSIPEGVVFGVIGPNGAGKSTFMRILCDLVRPTSGTVRVLGVDPKNSGPQVRAKIGYLPGELHVPRKTSGRQLLKYWAGLRSDSGASLRKAAELSRY